MDLEGIDYISRKNNSPENAHLPETIKLNSLLYYHARPLPKNISKDKFFQEIGLALPSCKYGFMWHHVPFGGIHPGFGKYAITVKDKYVEVMSEHEKGGENLADLLSTLAKKSAI